LPATAEITMSMPASARGCGAAAAHRAHRKGKLAQPAQCGAAVVAAGAGEQNPPPVQRLQCLRADEFGRVHRVRIIRSGRLARLAGATPASGPRISTRWVRNTLARPRHRSSTGA